LENTYLKDQKCLEKLLAVIAITFVWVYLIGEYENQQKPIPILTHQRRAFSIFRYGLDIGCTNVTKKFPQLFEVFYVDFTLCFIFLNLLS